MTTETTPDFSTAEANLSDVASALFGNEPATAPEPQEDAPEQAPEAAVEEPETPEQEQEETAEQKAEKDNKSANRFTKQTRELRETQRQLREMQAQLEALKKPAETPLTEAKAADTKQAVEAPDPAKYQYGELDPQYFKDTARHEAKLLFDAAMAEQRQQQELSQREAAAQRKAETLQTTAAKIEQAGASKFDDFMEKVVEGGQNGDYPLTREMFETVTEVAPEFQPDVLYYLASYPDEAEKVAAMNPRQQALWFGRLEAEIKATATKPEPRKATAAPPPPSASPRGSGSKGGVALDDLNDPRALKAMAKALFG